MFYPDDEDRIPALWEGAFEPLSEEDFGAFAEATFDPDESPVDLYGPDEYQPYPDW